MDAKTLKKLLELEEKNPGKLDEILSKMEEKEPAPAKSPTKAQVRKEAVRTLKKELGSGFAKYLQQDFPTKPRS